MMRPVLMIVSYLMLAALVIGPMLFFSGSIELGKSTLILNIATVGWFVTAPFWMNRAKQEKTEGDA